MFSFPVAYYVSCFLASYAVIQIASVTCQREIPRAFAGNIKTVFLAVILILAAVPLFFMTENRNINDYQGGMDANKQAILFSLAVATSMLLNRLKINLFKKSD